ncbi:CBS domain-containing protein [Ornithinimicrobium sp. INDO-MA30-4]|uniref:CBS domain-containing protein n=1 Tax=Ornithinimicrobium sp. INDO-MA30-4 TaxID=2908651 RepID=UPI001F461C86|nr:CBS domain-containing protein [Ornithinimicrobium sp. INDO-MA30-4]UJH69712.1 CBS domain-containing protein [Ornithinimicrobium sp. INDO-MA30-4]
MGDKIVVLKEQSHIAQFASPEEILSSPADDYVSDFIGQGASLKRLNLTRIRDIEMATDTPTGTAHEELSTLRQRLAESPWSTMMILDDQRRPLRWVGARDLSRAHAGEDIAKLGLPATATVEPQATLSDALNELITSNGGVAIVVDGSGVFQGVVDIESILTAVRTMREENSKFYLAQKEFTEAID